MKTALAVESNLYGFACTERSSALKNRKGRKFQTYIQDRVRFISCSDNGRLGVDPVVLFMKGLLRYLYGIHSLWQTHG